MRINEVVSKIRELKIQGATAIAKAGVRAFAGYVKDGSRSVKEDAEFAEKKMMNARPTEPMLMNAMNWVINKSKIRDDYVKYAEEFIKVKERSEEKITETGANLIEDGMNVFTHCHSSTVLRILKKAKKQGKDFNLVCFETRPLYQGRLTAEEAVNAGIRTTLTIDSAMTEAFEVFPPQLVLVGCDAYTKTFFVNKIGTDVLANSAHDHNVPFYACGETFKYTDNLVVEERDADELWKDRPEGLKVWNPAFDTVDNDLVNGYVTEKGIIKRVESSGL